MKKLKLLLVSGILLITGCSSVIKADISLSPKEAPVNPIVYSTNQNEFGNREINFGVVSDIHNEVEKAKKIANKFGKENLEGIIIAGDMSRHFNDKKNVPEEKEIRDSLIPFLETGKPVYVIAGNHETKNTYFKTMQELSGKYNNLFDLATLKYVDLDGVNIFGVSGGSPRPGGGFSVEKEIKKVDKNLFSLDKDPILMVSHMPPKFNQKGAIDCVYDVKLGNGKIVKDRHEGEKLIYEGKVVERLNFKNDGQEELTRLITGGNVDFSVSGHYHMNRGGNDFEKNILDREFSKKLFLTVGAGQYDMAGILTIKGDKAKYELLKVEN